MTYLTVAITVFLLNQSAIGILLDSGNAATASKSNVTHATIILKWFWACAIYTHTLTINDKYHIARTWCFAAVTILSMYVVHGLYSLDTYTLRTVHEQDSVVARHKRTNYTYAIACTLQHVTWYGHRLLMCYSQVSCKITRVTQMQVSSLNWAVLLSYSHTHLTVHN